jgi:hypothetical protein
MDGIIQLPAGWGEAEICADAPRIACAQAPGPRAYDHLGNRLSWFPPGDWGVKKSACDLEDCSRDVSFMAAQFGVQTVEFHQRWVASEVLAKLADVPILEWLKTHGLFACAPGAPVRAEFPGTRAELMVLADGPRRMAFGFVS